MVGLVVSSLRLRDPDGIDVLIAASHVQLIPSVIVIARSSLAAVELALVDHVMAYLLEPVTMDDLLPMMLLVIHRLEQLQESRQE